MEPSQLHNEHSHGAGAAMHKDVFSRLQVRVIEESLPRGQGADRDGRCLGVRKRAGLGATTEETGARQYSAVAPSG